MSDRLASIESMLKDEPDDAMLRYMYAMELWKSGSHEQSISEFQSLIQQATPHVPAFLMLGQRLAEINRIEESREVLRVGIEEARRQDNLHAASEMGELLSTLGESGL